ncbi:MAG TPA: hypothetical protein VM901_09725 [Bdellovibrionota bacterium]|nr:hypothetical protein [Bdellovibrionota bacterium]
MVLDFFLSLGVVITAIVAFVSQGDSVHTQLQERYQEFRETRWTCHKKP